MYCKVLFFTIPLHHDIKIRKYSSTDEKRSTRIVYPCYHRRAGGLPVGYYRKTQVCTVDCSGGHALSVAYAPQRRGTAGLSLGGIPLWSAPKILFFDRCRQRIFVGLDRKLATARPSGSAARTAHDKEWLIAFLVVINCRKSMIYDLQYIVFTLIVISYIFLKYFSKKFSIKTKS